MCKLAERESACGAFRIVRHCPQNVDVARFAKGWAFASVRTYSLQSQSQTWVGTWVDGKGIKQAFGPTRGNRD
ncbi:hypothetical protein GCM10011408_28010 [Dyella caseinilytica]|nr:hypothetical protein GCM10011408_28010 [Dyella caseinilytica]